MQYHLYREGTDKAFIIMESDYSIRAGDVISSKRAPDLLLVFKVLSVSLLADAAMMRADNARVVVKQI